MLEQSHQPNGLDVALQQLEREEKAIARNQLLQISGKLAELANLAKGLVRPIDLIHPGT